RWHKNAPRAIHLDIAGITDEKTLQAACLWIEAGKTIELLLDGLPNWLGVNQQTPGRIRCNNQMTCTERRQFVAVFCGYRESPLIVQTDRRPAAKHCCPLCSPGGREYAIFLPLSPTFTHCS